MKATNSSKFDHIVVPVRSVSLGLILTALTMEWRLWFFRKFLGEREGEFFKNPPRIYFYYNPPIICTAFFSQMSLPCSRRYSTYFSLTVRFPYSESRG